MGDVEMTLQSWWARYSYDVIRFPHRAASCPFCLRKAEENLRGMYRKPCLSWPLQPRRSTQFQTQNESILYPKTFL